VTVDGAEVDDDSERYQKDAGPQGESSGAGGQVGLGGGDLAEEEAEAADSESDTHEAEAGADPGQESSLGGEVDARVLFGGLGWIGHGGIVRQRQRVQVSGAGCRKLWFSWWYVVVGCVTEGNVGIKSPQIVVSKAHHSLALKIPSFAGCNPPSLPSYSFQQYRAQKTDQRVANH
jgi:hypothetical protein